MGVNKAVYVAVLDLGVLPIGLWLISIIFFILSAPLIFSKGFESSCTPLVIIFDTAGNSV